MLTLLLVMHKC